MGTLKRLKGQMRQKRPRNPMPAFVRSALAERGLLPAYRARPAYQRNDWLGWIARAKREDTRQRRLSEMVAELEAGHGYMGMRWEPLVAPAPRPVRAGSSGPGGEVRAGPCPPPPHSRSRSKRW